MEKIKYFKNFNVYKCKDCDSYYLKIEGCVNGQSFSCSIEISEVDFNKISKVLDNYNNEVKEILNNGK